MGKCKFMEVWLSQKDANGFIIGKWLKKHSEHEGFCQVCDKSFAVTKGYQSVEQHVEGKKHKDNCRLHLITSQLKLTATREPFKAKNTLNVINNVKIYDVRNKATTAELIWSMKMISADYSGASCDYIKDIFTGMFGEDATEKFSLSSKKFRYLVTDALGPYFKYVQKMDMKDTLFTLWYDETTNAAGVKELQIGARYWSNINNSIVSQHLETFFIGSATGKDLAGKLDIAMKHSSLPYTNLVMLGSDGPNVNKTVFSIINNAVKVHRKQGLLDIGTCNLHIVHNGYRRGLDELGEEASNLLYALHQFFDGWPSRSEIFEELQEKFQVPKHQFIEHISSRWLTMEPAGNRALEQWKPIVYFFLTHIPRVNIKLAKTNCFQNIVTLLKKPTIKAEVLFTVSSAQIFKQITEQFQREEPLIHMLHEELTSVVKTLIGRACKIITLKNPFSTENLLSVKEVIIDQKVKDELSKVSELEKTQFLHKAQNHFKAAAEHLLNKSSLQYNLLKSFRCFQPQQRKQARSLNDIVEVAKALPLEVRTDVLQDEWKLLQVLPDEKGSENWRIDKYWLQFFDKKNTVGNFMFPTVTKVVKAALSVSHGNADAERQFSTSGRVLTPDRASMSERFLNAVMTVKGVLKLHNNKPQNILVTRELLNMAHVAYKKYNEYLENKKIKEAEEEERKKYEEERKVTEKKRNEAMDRKRKHIARDEEKLAKMRKDEDKEKKRLDKLFDEANSRLKKAISKNNLEDAGLAQAMLEGAKAIKVSHDNTKKQVEELQKSIEKRKNRWIEDFATSNKKRKHS